MLCSTGLKDPHRAANNIFWLGDSIVDSIMPGLCLWILTLYKLGDDEVVKNSLKL